MHQPGPGNGATWRRLPVVGSIAEVVDLVRAHRTLYLRYSEGREDDLRSGSSRDYEAGVVLPSLSVTVVSPEPWWSRPVGQSYRG